MSEDELSNFNSGVRASEAVESGVEWSQRRPVLLDDS